MSDVAKLILNPNSSSRREISLARSLVSIGRDPSNDLVLPDAMVSRRHAVIEFRSSQYFIRDCNSSNGSLVNGDRVSERNLRDGDLVAIGTARILFREEALEAGAKVVPHPSSPRQQCPSCAADYRKGDAFCRGCGGSLSQLPHRVVCTACGTAVALPARFCNACGGPLALGATSPADLEVSGPEIALELPPVPLAESSVGGVRIRDAERLSPPSPPPPLILREEPQKPWLAPRPASLERPAPKPRTELAEPGPRFVAALIDLGLVGLLQALVLAPIAYYWLRRPWPPEPQDVLFVPILLSVAGASVALLAGLGYYVYFWATKGATPGKTAAGLAVETTDGRSPLGFGTALTRLFGYLISSILLGIGFLIVLFGQESLHDRIAGTRVVRRERD